MQGGDIDNREAPRVWFVWEGLMALPTRGFADFGGRGFNKTERRMNLWMESVDFNVHAGKILTDLHWRRDIRPMVVSFLMGDSLPWQEKIQHQLDSFDLPATARAMGLQRFLSTVVVAPACYAVYCADPRQALTFGGKAVVVDPHQYFSVR